MENKTGKYLKYAIGEIVLVVIGILIALWINSMNQERIKQVKIDSILVNIQNDMLLDIENGKWMIESYRSRDSISDRIMEGNLTIEDVKGIPKHGMLSLDFITSWSMPYNLQSNGYNELIKILDGLPGKYDQLVKLLNYNFLAKEKVFASLNGDSEDIVRQYRYYLADNQSWHDIDQYNNELSDAQIDFILNSPRFKSQVTLLLGSHRQKVQQYARYRKNLMEIYVMINELLGENARIIPKEIRITSVMNQTDADRLIGTYNLISGPENSRMGKRIEVFKKGKDLSVKTVSEKNIGPLLFLDSGNQWFTTVINYEGILCFEDKGENTLYIVNPFQKQTYWVKEIDE